MSAPATQHTDDDSLDNGHIIDNPASSSRAVRNASDNRTPAPGRLRPRNKALQPQHQHHGHDKIQMSHTPPSAVAADTIMDDSSVGILGPEQVKGDTADPFPVRPRVPETKGQRSHEALVLLGTNHRILGNPVNLHPNPTAANDSTTSLSLNTNTIGPLPNMPQRYVDPFPLRHGRGRDPYPIRSRVSTTDPFPRRARTTPVDRNPPDPFPKRRTNDPFPERASAPPVSWPVKNDQGVPDPFPQRARVATSDGISMDPFPSRSTNDPFPPRAGSSSTAESIDNGQDQAHNEDQVPNAGAGASVTPLYSTVGQLSRRRMAFVLMPPNPFRSAPDPNWDNIHPFQYHGHLPSMDPIHIRKTFQVWVRDDPPLLPAPLPPTTAMGGISDIPGLSPTATFVISDAQRDALRHDVEQMPDLDWNDLDSRLIALINARKHQLAIEEHLKDVLGYARSQLPTPIEELRRLLARLQ